MGTILIFGSWGIAGYLGAQQYPWYSVLIPAFILTFGSMLFTFIQCHSLVARRLNDIKVNPYIAFIPFLLASSYLLLKSFYDTYEYGHLIFIVILFVIVTYSIMMVSESD